MTPDDRSQDRADRPVTKPTSRPAASAVPLDSLRLLQARVADLERRNEQFDRFAATVAHELRTPLMSIEASAVLLTAPLAEALDSPASQDLDAIRRAARWMRVVIESLLEEARSQTQPP